MATYKSDTDITGQIGNLVFYMLNGKPVVRSKRRKMTKEEKKKLSPAIKRQNNRMSTVSTFCKMLRQGVFERFGCDTQRHEILVKHAFEILRRDHISPPDDFKIRKEHLHYLNGVVLNSEFPREILDKLNTSKFVWKGENLEVQVPKLPLGKLATQPEAFKLWVQLKILTLDKPFEIRYVRLKESDPIEISNTDGMTFSFDMPKAGENEGLFGTIGFKSLKDGKMIEDAGMNGYVVNC